jgi:hypothetical protein
MGTEVGLSYQLRVRESIHLLRGAEIEVRQDTMWLIKRVPAAEVSNCTGIWGWAAKPLPSPFQCKGGWTLAVRKQPLPSHPGSIPANSQASPQERTLCFLLGHSAWWSD